MNIFESTNQFKSNAESKYQRNTRKMTDNFDKHRESLHRVIDVAPMHPIAGIVCKIGADIVMSLLKTSLSEIETESNLEQAKLQKKTRKLDKKVRKE